MALGGSQRKERGAIAAQACDTCRSRKQKCDEQRPKCSTCLKFKLECNYREPQPTKKDKTLVEILDRLKCLEGKIDSLTIRGPMTPAGLVSYPPTSHGMLSQTPSLSFASSGLVAAVPNSTFHRLSDTPSILSLSAEVEYKHASSVHQLLAWPAMKQFLPKLPVMDPATIERDGPALALGLHTLDELLGNDPTQPLHRKSLGLTADTTASLMTGPPGLDWDAMQRLSKAYFDSFNFIHPILDRQTFQSETLPAILRDGFTETIGSTLAFLVFALGEVAISGTQGQPAQMFNGRPSGIKGGSNQQPPGLTLFNEARKRMGFNLTECSLENIQIFALASLYYGTCSHHVEFWRTTTSASLACQALISSNPAELKSPQLDTSLRTDMIKRLFWHCCIMETCLNLELGLPLTGLERMEAIVGLPDFSGSFSQDDYLGNQGSHYQEHFVSEIALRRLLVDFHNTLTQGNGALAPSISGPLGSGTSSTTSLNRHIIFQLAHQLEQWRGMLPVSLHWQEESPGAFPTTTMEQYSGTSSNSSSIYTPPTQTIQPASVASPALSAAANPQQGGGGPPSSQATLNAHNAAAAAAAAFNLNLMFTTDLDAPPTPYPFSLDIQVALLRSRYYYTKHLLHRPFVYKALHAAPGSLTHDDAEGIAACLRAGLKWPIAMSPACAKKRLLPCLFFWSQNLLGVLVVLHLSRTVPVLRTVRSTLCGERFEMEAQETVGLYVDWLRDLRAVDGAAGWCWEVARGLYGFES